MQAIATANLTDAVDRLLEVRREYLRAFLTEDAIEAAESLAELEAPKTDRWSPGAPTIAFLAQEKLLESTFLNLARSPIAAAGPLGTGRVVHVPPERRTSPLTLQKAAELMGYTGGKQERAARLKRLIDDGGIIYEKLSRQSYVFDRNSFPKAVWPRICPGADDTKGR